MSRRIFRFSTVYTAKQLGGLTRRNDFGRCDEWHVDTEFTPFAIKLDNLDHRPGFQVFPG